MKNKFIEQYAKLRETVDFRVETSAATSFNVSIFGAFNEESWLKNIKKYGSCTVKNEVLYEIFMLYYYSSRKNLVGTKNYIAVVNSDAGDSYMCRINERNLDSYGRISPFMEIIEIRDEDEFYNAYDFFLSNPVMPKVFGSTENTNNKKIETNNFKVQYFKRTEHKIPKDFLYVDMEKKVISSLGDNPLDMNFVEKDDREQYKSSVQKIKTL